MFTQYLQQFSQDTNSVQTHLSFNKGKYNVPDDKYDEFYQKYYDAMKTDSGNLYLIEKVYNSHFAFFLDIECPKSKPGLQALDDKLAQDIIKATKESIVKVTKDTAQFTNYVVSKRQDRYHVNFYDLIVDHASAKEIYNNVESKYRDYIDQSVYRTGLRMLGSKKSQKEEQVYTLYNLEDATSTPLSETTYDDFIKTVVRRKVDAQLSMPSSKEQTKIQVKGIENNAILTEISDLLLELKVTNECVSKFDMSIQRIYAAHNKSGMFCYYISIKELHCPFKDRQHQRESGPLYLEIGMQGVFIKCYDQDCLRQKYPSSGLVLPIDFKNKYSQLFMSMTTKYWKAEVEITDDIKAHLEESLCGSHYQISKTAFSIFKDKFRVDDTRNTNWYEYDGTRWKPSHSMNILISEDLPRYYQGIKISDTSVPNADLKQFLVNNEKVDANVRNGLVDMIVSKLENVNFKSNIMNQMSYLFKNHDPHFVNKLDSNPYLLAFKNGVYNFKTNEFRPSLPTDYVTFSTGYDYIDYASTQDSKEVAEIYDFLSKIIPNKDVREYLLKILGKSLLGIPDEKFYIWTGLSGANGKSTLVNFLESTLGDYITSVDVALLTNKRANASNASPDIVRLKGKRIFTFQEPEHDDKLRTGILKQFTGGDSIIARELFKAPVSFKLQGTMVMCCNDLPTVMSADGGTWRRIRVIEFKSRFCDHPNPLKKNEFKIDTSIKAKMQGWRPFFMSMLIHWYQKFLEEGMVEPDEVKQATANYKNDNDKFNDFFDQCLEECEGAFEANKDIYNNSFTTWWDANYPNSKTPELKELKRALKVKYGTEKEHVLLNGMKQKGFNVRIKLENSNFEQNDDDDL
jgi:P4 family phage/plasmid primase-like protien